MLMWLSAITRIMLDNKITGTCEAFQFVLEQFYNDFYNFPYTFVPFITYNSFLKESNQSSM